MTENQSIPASTISRPTFLFVLLLFFISGATGLIYEVIWTRILLNVFGASLYAVATVLAAFMGGLALGSLIGGRIADRIAKPLKLYGILEILVAGTALAVPFMLDLFNPLYRAVYASHQPTFMGLSLLRFVLSFGVLLIPTTCMGATLPLLSRFLVRRQDGLGGRIGALYTINTTGAVAGTFMAGFVLIATLGVNGTVLLSAALGIVIGIAAIIASLRLEKDLGEHWQEKLPEGDTALAEAEKADEQPDEVMEGLQCVTPRHARLILIIYGLSGFIALAYQVFWSRTLPFRFDYLKNTTYSFSAMLTVFLVGLACGSALMSSQIDKQRRPFRLFGLLQVLIGLTGVFSLYMLTGLSDRLPLINAFNSATNTFSWPLAVFNIFAKTAVTLALPTFLMGMTFPVAARLCVQHLRSVGSGTGRLYAVNTLGAILGSFAAGFVMVPLFGLRNGIILLGIANIVLGIIVLLANPQASMKSRVIFAATSAVLFALMLLRLDAPKTFQVLEGDHKFIAYEEGPLATVSVVEDTLGYRSIFVDGVNVAGTDPYMLTDQKSLAHAPALLLENPKKALTVGFGSGGASWSYLQYDELEQVDCIEISRTVPKMAQYLKDSNMGLMDEWDTETPLEEVTLHDGRYRVIIDDARSYLRFTRERYDIIATDCTDLRYKSNANLYDQQYFQLCRDAITDDGMVVVWMPLAGMSEEVFTVATRTFGEAFPDMTVWFYNNRYTHYVLLLGMKKPLEISIDRMQERLARDKVRRDLEPIDLQQPEKILSCFLNQYDRDLKEPMDAISMELNTENSPYLEFQSPKYGYGPEPMIQNLELLREHRSSVMPYIIDKAENPDAVEFLQRLEQAVDPILDGHRHYRRTELVEACEDYLNALAIVPEDVSVQELLRFEELRRRIEYNQKENTPDPYGMTTYGRILLMQNQPRKAAQYLDKGAHMAYTNILTFNSTLQNPKLDISQSARIRDEMKLNMNFHAQAVIALAMCYNDLGHKDRAIEILESSMRIHQNNPAYVEVLNTLREKDTEK